MNTNSSLGDRLFVLDVGHGNCAVLISEGAEQPEVVVIDVGRRNTLLEFLEQQRIKRIQTVYLSHADADHIGGLVGLLASDSVSIDNVVLNSDASKGSAAWRDLLYILDSAHTEGAVKFRPGLFSGDCEQVGTIKIEVLAPSRYLASRGVSREDRSSRKIHSNSISAVIRISISGRDLVTLPGDIDGVGLADLLGRGADLKATIIVYPHHGGRSEGMKNREFVERLIGAVCPEIVVFSIGRGRYDTPDPETIQALKEILPSVRIMCTQLSEHCSKSAHNSSQLTHLSDAFSEGQGRGFCCAGTIMIPLRELQDLEPSESAHLEFIRSKVESPLCLRDPNPTGLGNAN